MATSDDRQASINQHRELDSSPAGDGLGCCTPSLLCSFPAQIPQSFFASSGNHTGPEQTIMAQITSPWRKVSGISSRSRKEERTVLMLRTRLASRGTALVDRSVDCSISKTCFFGHVQVHKSEKQTVATLP
jgi:hypothetical protein